MPELPEVETTKASLAPLIGHTITQVHCYQPRLRELAPNDLDSLVGFRLASVTRRAKYLIARFVNTDGRSKSLLIHLGMSGSLQQHLANTPPTKHDHLTMTLAAAQGAEPISLRYHDPRRFGCILWLNSETQGKLIDTLGPEPLSTEFNAEYLASKLKNKSVGTKIAIMDNHVVVGVGNIYATESLFNVGIHPAQPAGDLSFQQIEKLVVEIKRILKSAIELGGSTLRDYSNAMGENGYFQQTLLAY